MSGSIVDKLAMLPQERMIYQPVEPCTACRGEGALWYGFGGWTSGGSVEECPYCFGTGIEFGYTCPTCGTWEHAGPTLGLSINMGWKCGACMIRDMEAYNARIEAKAQPA